MKHAFLTLAFALLTAGCMQNPYESESRYPMAQSMTPQSVERCRVLEWRWVDIGARPVRSSSSFYGRTTEAQTGPYSTTGAALGTIGGALLVQEALGSDNPYAIMAGALVGSAAGQNAGARFDMRSSARRGIEYSVITANGNESIITQPFNDGDRVAQAGSTCRLAEGQSGTRVLPGDHLPGAVNRPMVTQVR